MFLTIFGLILILFFIYAVVVSFKFFRSDLGKSEEGGDIILAKSSQNALPIFPVGWIAIDLYHRFIANIPYETYRDGMLALMLLLFVVEGFSIRYYKKKQAVDS